MANKEGVVCDLKIKIKDVLLYVGFALFFFNAFCTIPVFVNTGVACYMMIFLALLLIFQYCNNGGNIKINAKKIFVWMLLLVPLLHKNYDIKSGSYYQIVYFYSFFFILIFLSDRKMWIDKPWNVIKFYCTVHFLVGIFLLINKDILYNYVIPNLYFHENGSTKRLLYEAIDNGYMTGLCNHYSKMGMIMSLGVISMTGCLFDKKKDIKKIIVLVLFIVGLGLTGKRGPTLFTLISIFSTLYLFSQKKLTKKQLLKVFIECIATIVLFIIVYIRVPQVQKLIGRLLEEGADINTLSTGRVSLFWVNAWTLFKGHPFVGNGWRSFRNLVVTMFGNNSANDAHNIYFQLLAEVGIIGFIAIVTFMILTWRKTYRLIKDKSVSAENDNVVVILKMSLCYETFFMLYGFTGNPLYDMVCYFPYLLCCVITWSFHRNVVTKKG